MKNLKVIIVALMAAGVMTSCVSNRKYKEAISSKSRLEQQNNELQESNQKMKADMNRLQSDMDRLKESSSAQLKDRETALGEKEQMLNAEQRKLQEMKSLIEAQRNAISNLKKEVCSALKCFTPDELKVEVRDGKLYVSMSDKLLFPSGSDVVNARGKEAISMLAAVLNNSDLEIMVEGHTDPVPINTVVNRDNWDLSTRRATSVTRIFADNGTSPQRIIASGRAYYHPVAENETSEGRQLNRRTEIVLSPRLDKLWKLTEQEDAISAVGEGK